MRSCRLRAAIGAAEALTGHEPSRYRLPPWLRHRRGVERTDKRPPDTRLTDQAARELDPKKRLPLQTQALKIAKDEIMLIPLHQQPMAWATSAKVTGVVQLADNKPRLWYTRMK